MSYCRKNNESDIYLYHNGDSFVCHGCILCGEHSDDEPINVEMYSTAQLMRHAEAHHNAGHKVPLGAIARATAGKPNTN